MTENSMAIKSNDENKVTKQNEEKGKKREENRLNSKNSRFAQNFNFISIRYLIYNCAVQQYFEHVKGSKRL